mgnify:CR=1 FL=1
MNMKTNSVCFDLKLLQDVIETATESLITKHHVGFFDGGCYSLAKCLNDLFGSRAQLYHISRAEDLRDHAVVYFEEFDKYFDADGLQTKTELFHKMKHSELVDVKCLHPFPDIMAYTIFSDIVKIIHNSYLAGCAKESLR